MGGYSRISSRKEGRLCKIRCSLGTLGKGVR